MDVVCGITLKQDFAGRSARYDVVCMEVRIRSLERRDGRHRGHLLRLDAESHHDCSAHRDQHLIRSLFLPRSARGGASETTARIRSSFHRAIRRIRSSSSRRARSRSRLYRSKARKQSSRFSEQTISSERRVWPDRRGASRRSRQWRTPSSCGWRKRRSFA